jgi:hypothetical protein
MNTHWVEVNIKKGQMKLLISRVRRKWNSIKLLVRKSEYKGEVAINKHKNECNTENDLRAKEGCGMELFVSDKGAKVRCYRKSTKSSGPPKE